MNMFEIEREIFTLAADAVLAVFSECNISNAVIYSPAEFPCISIVMSDDGMTNGMHDSSKADNFRDITLTVDSYSNKNNGKKTESEAIMQIVIDTLTPLNFKLVSCRPNSNNNSYYRITATFTATVDKDGNIFTRK